MKRLYTVSISVAMAALFGIVLWQAATRPVTVREAMLWDHLVRPPLRQAFLDAQAWHGLIYAVLAKRTAGLFRLSEFSLRLPALLGCAVFLWTMRRRFPVAGTLTALAAFGAGWFSSADPHAVALAFCALAVANRSADAVFMGLAVATSPDFAIVLLGFTIWQVFRHDWSAVDRTLIPAVTIAFVLLIIPLSHAAVAAPVGIRGREASSARDALRSLRGRGPLRLSADPAVLPLLQFYRARYRQRDWEVTATDPQFRLNSRGAPEP